MTTKDPLALDHPRIGALVDFNPETPNHTAMLVRSDNGISLTVPWSHRDSPYARWFVDRDPFSGASEERITAPSQLRFQDVHGAILLVGCYARGYRADVFGPGEGTVWARYAVVKALGVKPYAELHGLRAEVSGLRQWLGIRSWQVTWKSVEPRGITVTSENIPTVKVGPIEATGLELSFEPAWKFSEDSENNAHHAHDYLYSKTTSNDPVAWDAHLDVHRALRDLLLLSSWRAESCTVNRVYRADDKTPDYPSSWYDVVQAASEDIDPPSKNVHHLIHYADIGSSGLHRWIGLRSGFRRAIAPVVSSKSLNHVSPMNMLAQSVPGLEALGYLLMLRDNVEEKKAAFAPNTIRFDRILQDLGDVLPFDTSAWKKNTLDAYNGVKHANQPEPDEIDVLNAWRESVMVMRAWVAIELGVPAELVQERLADDPQRHAWVKVG
jgi:hypothetical protein